MFTQAIKPVSVVHAAPVMIVDPIANALTLELLLLLLQVIISDLCITRTCFQLVPKLSKLVLCTRQTSSTA